MTDTDSSEPTIHVLLADDHPALRIGLRILLEQASDIEVVAEAADGDEALRLIEAAQPEVAVLDCLLPVRAGADVAQEVQRRGLSTRVLALSAYSDERYVREMLAAGAIGYLVKEEAPAVMVAAVRAAAKGEGWFSPAVASWVTAWSQGKTTGHADLTERELEVLRLIAGGRSNKEIAHALKVADRTVEFHVGNLLAKLGVVSRVEAAVWANSHGLSAVN